MEWIAAVIALVAASAAVWQAREARRANKAAHESSSSAAVHAEQTAAAQTRMAEVLEQMHLAQVSRENDRPIWSIEPKSERSWVLRNVSDLSLVISNVQWNEGTIVRTDPESFPLTVRPGGLIVIHWFKSFGSPSILEIDIEWKAEESDVLRHSSHSIS